MALTESQLEAQARYREKNPETKKRYKTKTRNAVLAILGDVCVRCGFTDKRALQIDHIHGGGRQEREAKGWWHILTDIVANGPQGKYQLLCANCNTIKRMENKEHSLGRRSSH